ncbi:unnamed protein product [Schistosoma mattheei]|uniref:Uncharacterized protein n=1 Tax=Schistosoma mattheei TaxID=31246 RepID=A0A3P8ITV4_9TREM|nr:unnamed protein product [Schistosoma mattheei]
MKNSTTNTYFIQARNYESNGEYLRAVEYYLKITPNTNSVDNNSNDSIKQSITPELCENAWLHAASLAVKFLPTDSSVKVTELVASRLASIQYDTPKKLAGNYRKPERPVKSKEGEVITNIEEQRNRWVEHFKELLNRPAPLNPPNIEAAPTDLPIDVGSTIEEISMAIRQIKSGKATGPDNIPAEALKADVAATARILHILFNKIWDEEQVPTEWKEGHLIKIPKKGDLSKCESYRGITLLSIPGSLQQGIVKQNEGLHRRPTSLQRIIHLATESMVSFTCVTRHTLAGELLLSIDKIHKAIDAFIADENWSKAKCVARELEPRLEAYVEAKYKEALKGQADTLASVDINSALDMYAEQGKWEKCLSTVEQLLNEAKQNVNGHSMKGNGNNTNTLSSSNVLKEYQRLHKYVAVYAANLIKDSRVYDAMLLYKKYGTPAYKQNFNIYKRIFQGITSQRGLYGSDAYPTWSTLRDILFDLNQNLKQTKSDIQPEIIKLFDRMLLVTHYYAIRSALLSTQQDVKEVSFEFD